MDPLLLISGGVDDPDFFYATRFPVERAVYIRFGEGDDVLAVSQMEVARALQATGAARTVNRDDAGWVENQDGTIGWAGVAAWLLRERGVVRARVSPLLEAGLYEALREMGIEVYVDRGLFLAERRRKSQEEVSFIHSAQRAAEAACAEVAAHLAVAEIRDGKLWLDGRPLTSERLMNRAHSALHEIGYSCPDMIVAGSPGSAMPHFRGEGQLAANAPVIVDIFPRGSRSRYYGDLTRTVVVGDASEGVRAMHEAVLRAMDAALALIRPGANGRDLHRAACQSLLDAGYGTNTPGLEGREDGPRMNHSLGHGVGIDVHEAPYLRDVDYPLALGDVISVEPGLYLPGLGGVRVEDTGLVTAEGFRSFSSLSRSLDPKAYL